VTLSFAGVVWVVSKGNPRTLLDTGLAQGDALALVTSAIYVGYSLALRRAPAVHWASLLWAMCVAAVVVSVPFFLWEGLSRGFRLPVWQAWLLLVYVTVFIAILSKLFYMESVIAIGAGRAALTMNLLPDGNGCPDEGKQHHGTDDAEDAIREIEALIAAVAIERVGHDKQPQQAGDNQEPE